MKKRRLFAQTLTVLLCLALLCPLTAFAEDAGNPYIPADPTSYAVVDPEAMQKLVEDYISVRHLDRDDISIGYCYLDSGDTWYFNGDRWYFGAGVYYVPTLMLMAEWESSGKVTRDTEFKGIALGDLERYILIYNSNYYVHDVVNAMGTEEEVRAKYRGYSTLPEEYYDPDFLEHGYFSTRFLVDVMKTLYYENERFPNIIECMKQADNGYYFHGAMRGQYEVAQKFGNLIDKRKVEYNNTAGIIYTPHPFILTVMTENMGVSQEIMWDMAVIFKDYTLSLDEAYDAWDAAGRQTPAAAPAETPEPAPAEEEQPAAAEDGAQEQPAEDQAGTAQAPAADENPAEEGKIEPVPAAEQKEENPSNSRRMAVIILCAAALVVMILATILKPILRRKKQSDEDELLY